MFDGLRSGSFADVISNRNEEIIGSTRMEYDFRNHHAQMETLS